MYYLHLILLIVNSVYSEKIVFNSSLSDYNWLGAKTFETNYLIPEPGWISNFTYGFSGNISIASTKYHNTVVVCGVMSPETCRSASQTKEGVVCNKKFSIRKLKKNLCTHILYYDQFVFWPTSGNPTYLGNITDRFFHNELGENLKILKKELGNPKILLQIRDRFRKVENQTMETELPKVARIRKLRQAFIADVITSLKMYNLDGLDIWFQLPSLSDLNDMGDAMENRKRMRVLPILMHEIREGFKRQNYIFSFSIYETTKQFNSQELKRLSLHRSIQFVDQVHVLKRLPSLSAVMEKPLIKKYMPPWDNVPSTILDSVIQLGFPPNKIILGISLIVAIHEYEHNSTSLVKFSGYSTICKLCKDTILWNPYYSPSAMITVVRPYTTRIRLGFESPRSIKEKIKWGLLKNVRGIMVDCISNDDFDGNTCGNQRVKFPILRTVNFELAKQYQNKPLTNKTTVKINNTEIFFNPTNKIIICDQHGTDLHSTIHIITLSKDLELNFTERHEIYSACTHFSVAFITGVVPETLQMNQTILRNFMGADRPKKVFDHWISPITIRDAYPHLKLMLTLMLLSGRDDVNGFYLIAFPAKNRDVFIRGVVNNLLEFGLNGIELFVGNSQSQRTMVLLYILLQELHKKLLFYNLKLHFYFLYGDSFVFLFNATIISNHVDYLNLVPIMAYLSLNATIKNTSVIQEGVEYLATNGVSLDKIIIVMHLSAFRFKSEHNPEGFLPAYELCTILTIFPKRCKVLLQYGKVIVLYDGSVHIFESADLRTKGIKAAINAGVAGFEIATKTDRFDGMLCERDKPFRTLRIIHKLLKIPEIGMNV